LRWLPWQYLVNCHRLIEPPIATAEAHQAYANALLKGDDPPAVPLLWAGTECAALATVALAPTTGMVS
jgi:hypothetical protein